MTRQKLTIGIVAAAFTLSAAPAVWAQAGSRPNTTGSSSGSAAPRGGGESSSSGSSSSGSSSSGSSTSGSSSSSGSMGSSSSRGESRARERAPEHPSQRAVPRGSSANSRGGDRAVVRGSGSSATTGSDSVTRGRSRAAVPEYSRPRDGRNATGTAVERREPIPGNNGGNFYYPGIYYPYDPFYSSYYGSYYSRYGYYPYSRYWAPGYGFGLGYFAYDPFMFGGYDYYGGGYSSGGYSSQYRDVGNIRLKVKPNDAQVYVDGYFVGVVDSFDGVFQKLGIESGAHRIELRAEGYETVQFEVLVTPGETITYKGEMKPQIR